MFNILLQVLDDGRLTDGQGRTVDFRNTHHRADQQPRQPGDRRAAGERGYRGGAAGGDAGGAGALPAGVPQPAGRDRAVPAAGAEDMAAIVDIQLGRLRRLLEDRKITLELDDAAREWLAEAGYDPVYGARPLKRVIQRSLQDQLAEPAAGRPRPGWRAPCRSPPVRMGWRCGRGPWRRGLRGLGGGVRRPRPDASIGRRHLLHRLQPRQPGLQVAAGGRKAAVRGR